jgi:hypothetical protein
MGFIDTTTPPVGIWAAFNQIKGAEGSRAHDRIASQPPGDAGTIDAVDAAKRGLAQRPGGRDEHRSNRPMSPRRAPTRTRSSRMNNCCASAKAGQIDVYFMGDSITRRWGATDENYQDLLANWRANFTGWNAADFGWGADKTQHMLWRLQNGELDGVNPRSSC